LKKIPLFILTFVFIMVGFLFIRFVPLYNQEGNPLTIASAAIKLALNNSSIETISTQPEEYLVRTTDGIDPVVSLMESKGWHYKERMGSGIVFVNNGELLTLESRMYSKHYMIISSPEANSRTVNATSTTINLTATGDILMHNTVIASGKNGASYNFDHLFAPVQHLIAEGDYASVNLECALAGPSTGYTGYPLFNSPDSIANALHNSEFDLVVTANNHILDRGYQGAVRTMDVLRQAGFDTTGTFKTQKEKQNFLIKDIRGVKVGYLAYSYSTNGIPVPQNNPYFYNFLEPDKIINDISALRPDVDVLVLILHWGVEYSPYPTQQQRKLATEFFQNGADIILGSHPHVIQPMEIMKINGQDKFVIYSMGNSMGNQNGVERNSGVILNLQFTKNLTQGDTNLTGVSYTPTFIHPYYADGRRMFRVIPIEETIKAIEAGQDPYLGRDSLPLLQQVLAATNATLNRPLK